MAALILLTSALSLALVAKDKAQDLANPIFLATAGLFIVGSVLLVVGLGKRMGGLGFALGAMGALASAACMVWLVTKVNARSAPTKKAREADFSGVCEDSSAKDKAAPKYDPSKPGKHPTVFYYKQPTGSWLRSNDTAYKPYKPEELSAEEIELIACVAEKPATVEVCQYTTDPAAQKAEGSLKRLRLDLEVKLVSLRTGKTIAEASVEGAAPPSCPPTQQLGREIDLRGARPEYTAVVASIVTHLKTK